MTDTTPTPADRPAEGLAATIETVLRESLPVWWQTPPRLDWAALAVARQLLGTTTSEGPAAVPSVDRRARYATAIRETDGWVLDDGQHMIDAVMAVADAEQASLRAEAEGLDEALRGAISASDKDGARLRTERAAEVEDLRAELDKLIRWHKEDGAQAVKAGATITRLRAERAELNRQLDCLRGDMREMESCLREQDAEFERIRRAASEAQSARRRLTPNEHDRAWHAIEGSAGEEGADPGTVLNAVLHALRIDAPTAAEEQAASPSRRLADDAAAGVQQTTEGETKLTATLVINRSDSYCDGCGKPTLPRRTHHTDISGWTPRPGEGCGARFVATRSDYRGITPDDLKDVRPDLPVATLAAPAAPEEPTG